MSITISNTSARIQYTATSSQTQFTVPFEFFADADLLVVHTNAAGTDTTLSLAANPSSVSQYSVSGAGESGGGSITLGSGATAGDKYTIQRNLALERTTDFPNSGTFPIETLNTELDKIVALLQQAEVKINLSPKASSSTSTAFGLTFPELVANKLLTVNSAGDGLEFSQEIGTFKGNWAASTSYAQRDIVKDTSTNNIFLVNSAHTSTGAQPLTSNANSAKYDLLVDASSATTSATNAASSATAAASSASSALSHKNDAETAKTASETAQTASETAKTAAETAQTAAETAKTAAETALDTFDDRFLGAKSSDPSTDNDGNSLITGAQYFNTSNNVMMVYNGSAFQRTTPTSSDQTNINALSASAVITDMGLLGNADVIADMALLADADVISDMNTLATADIVSDLNTLATSDIVSDLNTLATSDIISDINTLATSDIVSDLNTLATSDIVTDLNLLATSDNVTNMATLGASGVVSNIGTVAGSISNVNTAAANISGINSFGERYRVGSSDPSSNNDEGDLFYNTTDNTFKFFNGSSYVAVNVAGIDNIVEDTTPQLGGNLDVNGNDIVTTSNADIELAPNGTGKTVLKGNTNPGTLVFNCESNSHGQTVKSQPHSAGVTNVLTLPSGGDQEIVGASATQTLTNKTIDASQLSGSIAEARLPAAALGAVWESKSTNFTAEARKNYFIDTSGGAITATLPSSGTLGDEIHFVDAVGTFDTNNLTVGRNSHKIQGATSDLTVDTERAGFTLVYYNAAQGWLLKDV